MSKPIILASASPRRREILTLAGIPFEVYPSAEESAPEGLLPADRVLALARSKATEVARRCPGRTVLGADTMVAQGAYVLGKPRTEEAAIEMLLSLQGQTHQVLTGVWVITTDAGGKVVKQDGFTDVAEVNFFPISYEEAVDYVSTGEPMDKAGAYGIQGKGMRFVESIQGDFYTVMGLPGGRLVRFLREFGIY